MRGQSGLAVRAAAKAIIRLRCCESHCQLVNFNCQFASNDVYYSCEDREDVPEKPDILAGLPHTNKPEIPYRKGKTMSTIPRISELLELYTTTPEGFYLWKSKDIELTYENLLDNVFIISSDLAAFFNIRHAHLTGQNIAKLQRERHLSDHLPKIRRMIEVGKTAKREQIVYALTRHQTEILIMDFVGPKAREKKIAILKRLQAIELDVLHGAYTEAREKAQSWDGVQMLKDLGFAGSINDGQIATKQDISVFLKIPESTLNNFLRKHRDEIKPTSLDIAAIRSIGSKANRMNGYHLEDTAKIAFSMDTEIGIELKKKLFGEVGVLANPYTKDEIQWRKVLAEIFKGFDLHYNHSICDGRYKVDYYVSKMALILECNGISHKYYNRQEEEKRERAITKRYALVRFHPKVSLETLFNGILQAKVGTVVRLYNLENICQ